MTVQDKVKREIAFEDEWKSKSCPVITNVVFNGNKPVLYKMNCLGSDCAHWTTTQIIAGKIRGVCTHK